MSELQELSSGVIIRQDISAAVRAVYFQTDYEEYRYATHGGTLFIVRFRGVYYGLTCMHVFGDFPPEHLFITQKQLAVKGQKPAPISRFVGPTNLRGDAAGSTLDDICVIEFDADIAPDFFVGSAYVIDERTVGTARPGHELHIFGALKDKTVIEYPNIIVGLCALQLLDTGNPTSDPVLRQGKAEVAFTQFENITGISGSPVFDRTGNILCGMVTRGGMTKNECSVLYFDMHYIMPLLDRVAKKEK